MPKDDKLLVVFAAACIGPFELLPTGPRLADPNKTLLSTTMLLSLFDIEVVTLNFDG